MTRPAVIAATILAVALAAVLLLWPAKAHANVTCSFTSASITFGASATATGNVGYSCSSSDLLGNSFTICSRLGSSSAGTAGAPLMNSGTNSLAFNLYTNSARTTPWSGSTAITGAVSIPGSLFGATVTGSLPFYGTVTAGQSPPAGTYTATFGATVLGIVQSGTCQQSYSSLIPLFFFTGASSTLSASAIVTNSCTISAPSSLNLGSVAATASGVWSSTTLSITCSPGAAWYVGLSPSNGSLVGAGVLTGTGGNPDRPSYQLRSTSNSGPVWGNTATVTSVGNGVGGTGTGSAQNVTAYATVPSANYKPDSYSDTVTVNVNF